MKRRKKGKYLFVKKSLWQIVTQDRIATIPNALTLIRILAIPVVAYYIYTHQIAMAFKIGIPAALTDAFDGFFARLLNQKSELGRLMDPFADKAMFVCIGLAMCLAGYLPFWFYFLELFRDGVIITTALLLVKKDINSIPESRNIGRYTFIFIMLTLLVHLFPEYSWGITFASYDIAGQVVSSIPFFLTVDLVKNVFLSLSSILIVVSLIDYGDFFIKLKTRLKPQKF